MFDIYLDTIENNFLSFAATKPVAIVTDYGYRIYSLGYFWNVVACIDGTWELILQNNNKGIKSNYHSLQYLCHCSDKNYFIEIFTTLDDGDYVEF